MPNPAIQRLIDASAVPMRGKAAIGSTAVPKIGGIGVPEIANAQPASSIIKPVSSIIKPMDATDWYNDDYAAASQSLLASKGQPGYQPPEFGTPEIKDYFEFTKGPGAWQKIEEKAYVSFAPQFSAAVKAGGYEKYLANLVKGGMSLPQIYKQIQTDYANKVDGLIKFPYGADYDVQKSASNYAKDLFNEYGTVKSKFNEFTTKVDPNYRFALPDPKFKYGATTNFKAGTIDVLNNYGAFLAYKKYEQQLTSSGKYTPAQVTQALSSAKTKLATELTKVGKTPFNDEKARRDALKKGK